MRRFFQGSMTVCTLLAATFVVGCGDGDKKMAMTPPPPAQRPAEMDQLAWMIGSWDFEMTGTMMGMDKPFVCKGTSTAAWDVDRWVITEHVQGTMGEMPGMFHGMGIYMYDPKAKAYRTGWLDNEGGMSHGRMTYDAGTQMWKTKGMSEKLASGAKSKGEGWMKMVDANTIEWGGTEYDAHGNKIMDMKGTSRRHGMAAATGTGAATAETMMPMK